MKSNPVSPSSINSAYFYIAGYPKSRNYWLLSNKMAVAVF